MDAIETRAVIKFLTKENETPTHIHERMAKVYGSSCPSLATVKRWAAEFKRGRESLEDDRRSGRPTTVSTHENIVAVMDVIMNDRRVSIDQIAAELGISHGTVWNIIDEDLDMKKLLPDGFQNC